MRFSTGTLRSVLVLAALGTTACGDDSDDDKTPDTTNALIKIGALADQTGTSADQSYGNALGLAEKHVNDALRQASVPVRYDVVVEDSQSKTDVAKAAAIKLVNTDGVKGMVADVSANTVEVNKLNYDMASPLANKVPVTCYACSSAFLNDPAANQPMDLVRQAAERDEENWLYRVFFNGKYEAAVSVRIMLNKPNEGDINNDGLFKVSVYAQNDPFGQSSATSLKNSVAQLLGERPHAVEIIFVDPTISPTSYDWQTDLAKLIDDRNETDPENVVTDGEPDAIFLALLPLLATGAVSARTDLGITIPMQSVTAFRRNYILDTIGEKAIGLEGDSPRAWENGISGSTFADEYQRSYSIIPEMLSAHVYDCAVTLMLGSLKAAVDLVDPSTVDPADVRAQMLSVTDPEGERIESTPDGLARAVTLIWQKQPINYVGASGVFPWDAAGDTFPELVHWTVVSEGPSFHEDEAYECSPDAPTCRLVE